MKTKKRKTGKSFFGRMTVVKKNVKVVCEIATIVTKLILLVKDIFR